MKYLGLTEKLQILTDRLTNSERSKIENPMEMDNDGYWLISWRLLIPRRQPVKLNYSISVTEIFWSFDV